MDERERIDLILRRLDEHYGRLFVCELNYRTPWQLLFAVMLSVQCRGQQVNRVTGRLFVSYPTLEAIAGADVAEIENQIHSLGFYHSKARNLIASARILLAKYGGQVPRRLEDLTVLPGVGRRTATVIRGILYQEPGIVVDTHVKRVSRNLGFTKEEDSERVEYDLMQVLPKNHWNDYNNQITTHGRSLCPAGSPLCGVCFLNELCPAGDCFWFREYQD